MSRMKLLGTVLALGVGLGMAAPASATVITQTLNFNFATLNQFTNLFFNGFDSSLGTLVEVDLSFSATVTLNDTALVFPPGSGDQSVGSPTPLTATANVTATGPLSTSATTTLNTPGFIGTVIDNSTIQTVGTASQLLLSNTGSAFNPPTDLSPYVGGLNAVDINVAASGTQGGSVPGTVQTGNNGNAAGTVTLVYDYNPPEVPEPATLTLLGMGLIGLAAARRRARKSAD